MNKAVAAGGVTEVGRKEPARKKRSHTRAALSRQKKKKGKEGRKKNNETKKKAVTTTQPTNLPGIVFVTTKRVVVAFACVDTTAGRSEWGGGEGGGRTPLKPKDADITHHTHLSLVNTISVLSHMPLDFSAATTLAMPSSSS